MAELRARLADAQETLRAIQHGEVDAVVVAENGIPRVYTLEGAEHAYRVLIESMNEGALTLTADKTILYANQCFAKMVKCSLEQVIGASLRRFISGDGRQAVRAFLKRPGKAGSKMQSFLTAADGSQMPVLVSMRPLAGNHADGAVACLVVTDMTEVLRSEETLRDLSHRLMGAQEVERGRVACELHDNITQLLCAIAIRSQVLVDTLPSPRDASWEEATNLREMVGEAATEVERITRNLRPSVLNVLGLVAALRGAGTEFATRTGVTVTVTCERLTAPLAAEAEMALYRILQEALRNVEKHAGARHLVVRLTQSGDFVEMVVEDDGAGFDASHRPTKRDKKRGFGLLSMRERATSVGGALTVKSAPGQGATILARIPCGGRTKPMPAVHESNGR